MSRIALYGGTFDPPHNGHLVLACGVADAYALDKVIIMPTGNPNFKRDQHVTRAEDRMHMVELLCAEDPRLEPSRMEIDRPGITYTADTLAQLRQENPGAELLFLVGGDSAATIMKWRNAQRIAELCTVVAVARVGYDFAQAKTALAASPIAFNVEWVEVDTPEVSSTQLRQMAAAGEDLSGLVPCSVASYIESSGIYAPGFLDEENVG